MAKDNSKRIFDEDLLRAHTYFDGYDPVVYGANGHYSIGDFSDLSGFRPDADNTSAAKQWKEGLKEELEDAYYLKDI